MMEQRQKMIKIGSNNYKLPCKNLQISKNTKKQIKHNISNNANILQL